MPWSEEDDKKLFLLFKKCGAKWSNIAKKFKNRTENQVKNRFYSTLRRIATKKRRDNPDLHIPDPKSKKDLLQYVDDALEYGHNCCSKRGRIKKRPETLTPSNGSPFSKVVVKAPTQTPSTNISQAEIPILYPLENASIQNIQLVDPVPATPEQMELARQLFKPALPSNLLFQLEQKEKEIAEIRQRILYSLFCLKYQQEMLIPQQNVVNSKYFA